MERRKFPRQDVRGVQLRATLVLTGGSLLKQDSLNTVEIDTHPIDLSQGGMCLALGIDAPWETFLCHREIDLFLSNGDTNTPMRAKVIRFEENDQVLGLEFARPLENMQRFS